MQEKIGIIGFGNMGSAIAGQLLNYYQLYAFDRDKNKTAGKRGIIVTRDLLTLVKSVDILLLAVKPQDLDPVLKSIRNYVKDKLIISIAAGISTKHIERMLGEVRVIRDRKSVV